MLSENPRTYAMSIVHLCHPTTAIHMWSTDASGQTRDREELLIAEHDLVETTEYNVNNSDDWFDKVLADPAARASLESQLRNGSVYMLTALRTLTYKRRQCRPDQPGVVDEQMFVAVCEVQYRKLKFRGLFHRSLDLAYLEYSNTCYVTKPNGDLSRSYRLPLALCTSRLVLISQTAADASHDAD